MNDNNMFRKFIVGRRYATRSICDHNCVFSFDVVGRTDKTVMLKQSDGKITRRGVRPSHRGDCEICMPYGRYSMAPVLGADDEVSA